MRQLHSLSIGLLLGMILPRVFEPASEVSVRVWVVLLALVIANVVSWFAFISGLTKRAGDTATPSAQSAGLAQPANR